VTYLYPTTYYGLPLVPHKAILLPTAHDEPTLYLSLFRSTFALPQYMVYNTFTEQQLVHRTFDNASIPYSVIGSGINVPCNTDVLRFRRKYDQYGDFILYVGRIDDSKNVSEMFDFFIRFKKHHALDVKLVLVGKGPFPIPERTDIVPLGFVSEQDKFDALQASSLLLLPSRYESLSMAVLEAWLMKKPVLVNGDCEVLKAQCVRGNGGLYYQNYDEFVLALQTLIQRPRLRDAFGACGYTYAQENYSWPVVERKYLQALRNFFQTRIVR
jgi:glycosyltransferase involved in cell wall biosynthesis